MGADNRGIRIPTNHLRYAMLKFHDQFLLWAARMWITESRRQPTMPLRVREAFEVAGVVEATDHLHDLLTIISTKADRTALFHPVGEPLVAEEEARFLTLLAAARHHACDAYIVTLLTEWLPKVAALRALAPARALALIAGTKLEPPASGRSHLLTGAQSGSSSPDPGFALLH